ncbi:hypothetical protein L3X38_025957 [Prunus dulcis]|uniref:Uncharacterized protein n=1 Tax=Prunus dulcis TaxID=3755 RepID=A0AAD4W2V4_PRUDU|nr:hypothetical protein L3X38_025957 [Prunus dulcis]
MALPPQKVDIPSRQSHHHHKLQYDLGTTSLIPFFTAVLNVHSRVHVQRNPSPCAIGLHTILSGPADLENGQLKQLSEEQADKEKGEKMINMLACRKHPRATLKVDRVFDLEHDQHVTV